MDKFQDVPTGFEIVHHDEREIVEEEGINVSQEALEEEQEAFVMNNAEVTLDLSWLNLISVAGTC